MRDKKQLPVFGQDQAPEVSEETVREPEREPYCTDECCAPSESEVEVETRPERRSEALEQANSGDASDQFERTVVRVEGMDCASCATTVEKCVGRLAGVQRATVNFAAGRLDAYHDDSVSVERLEQAVREAGYGVGESQQMEQTPFWRTPRFLLTVASALLFIV